MRKIIPVVAAGATALALAGGTFAYTTVQKDVVLSVDGASRNVTVMSSTVADVLAAEGITLTSRDVVAPAANASITDGTRIAVQYGRQVKVRVDGKQQSFWTTATDVDGALAALGIDTVGADLSTSRSAGIGRQGLSFDLATMKTITIDAAGTKRTVRTTAQTVAGALQAAKITVDANDLMSVKKTAALTDGGTFTVTRVDVKTVTEKKKVGYDTVRRKTSRLDKGDTRVDTSGKRGTRTLTYSEVRHNGQLTSRKKTSSKITKKPVTKVILVGTKVEKPKKTSDSSPTKKSGSTSTGSGVWDKIARCESGGNWAINTGNGFYGGLQFTLSTWRAYGGSGMPQNASRESQISVAKRVQAAQGWGAWPACTSKLGLR